MLNEDLTANQNCSCCSWFVVCLRDRYCLFAAVCDSTNRFDFNAYADVDADAGTLPNGNPNPSAGSDDHSDTVSSNTDPCPLDADQASTNRDPLPYSNPAC